MHFEDKVMNEVVVVWCIISIPTNTIPWHFTRKGGNSIFKMPSFFFFFFFCDRLYVVHNFNSARYAQDVNTLHDRPTLPSDVIRGQSCLDVRCLVFENGLRVVKKSHVLPPIFHVLFFLFLKKNFKNDYLICLSFIYEPYFDIWGSGNIGIWGL